MGRTGKEGLKRMCTTLEASKIDLSLADVADKKYLRQHDLSTITDISAGAATFYVWVRSYRYSVEYLGITSVLISVSSVFLSKMVFFYIQFLCAD